MTLVNPITNLKKKKKKKKVHTPVQIEIQTFHILLSITTFTLQAPGIVITKFNIIFSMLKSWLKTNIS